mgnify:CR=1 FL=1
MLKQCREVGFRLIAGFRSGSISQSDREVESSSNLSELFPVWQDDTEEEIFCYYENVSNFIPSNCIQWLEEHDYSKEYGASLPFMEQSARYVEALEVFNSSMSHFSSGKNNEGYS